LTSPTEELSAGAVLLPLEAGAAALLLLGAVLLLLDGAVLLEELDEVLEQAAIDRTIAAAITAVSAFFMLKTPFVSAALLQFCRAAYTIRTQILKMPVSIKPVHLPLINPCP